METPNATSPRGLHDRAFLLLLVLSTLAFMLILWPLNGALLWAVVLALVFMPLYRWLLKKMRQRRVLASLTTLVIIVIIVILPLTLVIASLVQQASAAYEKIQAGDLDVGTYFKRIFNALPAWVTNLLDRSGLTNLGILQQRLSTGLAQGSKFVVTQAINVGKNTFNFFVSLFVMLYLLFFLFRDGDELSKRIRAAIPLRNEQQRSLLNKFIVVTRATVKGNIVVAALQGALGGIIFWILGIQGALLWAVLMALLLLLPAVGAAIIWLPVAIYLLATGAVVKGIILLAYGVLVISLVDNVVRPILVGKDTRMPDYLVLISTLGGISIFGVNGFVLGPVIAAMFIAAWNIFSESRNKVLE
jgi:predicted PurR-regulated permease PerM